MMDNPTELFGDEDYDKEVVASHGRPCLGFDGSLGGNQVTPRGLCAQLLKQLVMVEGIVTKASLVKPKVVKAVHLNRKLNKVINVSVLLSVFVDTHTVKQKEYRDATSMWGNPTPAMFLRTDPDTNDPLSLEYGLCSYKVSSLCCSPLSPLLMLWQDHQTITLQEMPEKAPAGQLPRSVEVVLDDDLSDNVKPGDRVTVVGVYKALPSAFNSR